MGLEAVKLDDLQWQQMVTDIRGRIAAVSKGAWSLHAPVDPGITSLELFAYLLEQRLFWLDQIPEELLRAILALLDEPLQGTRVAHTLLQLDYRGIGGQAFHQVPAALRMQLRDRFPAIIYGTDAELSLMPVQAIGVETTAGDRSGDLNQGRWVELLPADDGAARFRLTLWLDQTLPTPAPAAPLSMFLELDHATQVYPQWHNDAVDAVPPPASLSWWYSTASGWRRFSAAQLSDGTGGLRRSGLLRLPIPDDWQALGPANVSGQLAYGIEVRVEEASFSSPPRLTRALANVVRAAHRQSLQLGETDFAEQVANWLPLPGLSLQLPDAARPPLEFSVHLELLERDAQWHPWRPVSDFSFHGPEDRVVLVERDAGRIRFGDGLNGRIPVLSSNAIGSRLRLHVHVGGGTEGNLGQGLQWEDVAAQGYFASNPVPAEDGLDAESVQQARDRVAAQLVQTQRAVTREDHETLALTAPGVAVARAHAAVGHHPLFPCAKVPGALTLFVVPEVPRWEAEDTPAHATWVAAPEPDPGLLTVLRRRLDRARLVASELYVRATDYRRVNLRVEVNADPIDPLPLQTRIQDALLRYLDPLVGGDDATGWPFGHPLRPSSLLRVVQDALGDDGGAEQVWIGLDDGPPTEFCNDVDIGAYRLVYFGDLQVQLLRTPTGQGGLR